jgi:hypothetical protein
LPKFFFNLVDADGSKIEDREGAELTDLDAAKKRAKEIAHAILEADAARQPNGKPN